MLPVFPGLAPLIWPRLLRLVTNVISDRLLLGPLHHLGGTRYYDRSRGRRVRFSSFVSREAYLANKEEMQSLSVLRFTLHEIRFTLSRVTKHGRWGDCETNRHA